MILFVVLGVAALVLIAMAYVRFTPVTADSGRPRPDAMAPGDYASEGGFYAVRALAKGADVTEMFERIVAERDANPRAAVVRGAAPDHDITAIQRSPAWEFPDITHIWVEGGNLHVASHLVYGRKDFDANKRIVEGVLKAAGL